MPLQVHCSRVIKMLPPLHLANRQTTALTMVLLGTQGMASLAWFVHMTGTLVSTAGLTPAAHCRPEAADTWAELVHRPLVLNSQLGDTNGVEWLQEDVAT